MPLALTIFASLERVQPSGTEAPDFDRGPSGRIVEAETHGLKHMEGISQAPPAANAWDVSWDVAAPRRADEAIAVEEGSALSRMRRYLLDVIETQETLNECFLAGGFLTPPGAL